MRDLEPGGEYENPSRAILVEFADNRVWVAKTGAEGPTVTVAGGFGKDVAVSKFFHGEGHSSAQGGILLCKLIIAGFSMSNNSPQREWGKG